MPQPHFAPPNFRLDTETRERLLRHLGPVAAGTCNPPIQWRRSVAPSVTAAGDEMVEQGTESVGSGSEGDDPHSA